MALYEILSYIHKGPHLRPRTLQARKSGITLDLQMMTCTMGRDLPNSARPVSGTPGT